MFCTYLTVYSGDKLPPFYVGSTSTKRLDEGYHGSVRSQALRKTWESELTANPDLFNTVILTTHTTREEALLKEVDIQKMFNVVRSPLFANASYARRGFVCLSHSDQTKAKIGAAHKGRRQTPEAIEAAAAGRRGKKFSPAGVESMKEWHRKNPMSEATKEKIAASKRGKNFWTPESKAKRLATIQKKESV